MHYASPRHARRCSNVMRGKKYSSRNLAALYLFTADSKLWRRWRLTVGSQNVDWDARQPIDPGWDGIALEQAARSLARRDHPQVTLYDLTDCAAYPTELILLVLSALLLARGERKPKFNERGRKSHVSA